MAGINPALVERSSARQEIGGADGSSLLGPLAATSLIHLDCNYPGRALITRKPSIAVGPGSWVDCVNMFS